MFAHLLAAGRKIRLNSSTTRTLLKYSSISGVLLLLNQRHLTPQSSVTACDSPVASPQRAQLVSPTSSLTRSWLGEVQHYLRLLYRSLYIYLCITPAVLSSPLILVGYEKLWSQLLKQCIELCGPCSIKFAQWIATRPDLFPQAVCITLEGLQSRSHVQSKSELFASMHESFGRNWRDIVNIHDEYAVLGAGCVAQVVEGEYNGQRVAVKVLHNGIKQSILADLAILHILASLVECIPGVPNMSLVETVLEFSNSMTNQLDMTREAHALDKFQRNFNTSKWKHVIGFPKVFCCTDSVLVESLEEGELMSSILKNNCLSATESKALAVLGLDSFLKMVFTDNFIHADLHPGNIIVKRFSNNQFKLIYIDTGLVVELTNVDRKNFIDLFSAIVFNDGAGVARLMIERSRGNNLVLNRSEFEKGVAEIVSDVHAKGLNLRRISVGAILQKILLLCYMHQVKLESRFANLALAIGVLEGLGRRLDPDVDIIKRAAPFIIKSAFTSTSTS